MVVLCPVVFLQVERSLQFLKHSRTVALSGVSAVYHPYFHLSRYIKLFIVAMWGSEPKSGPISVKFRLTTCISRNFNYSRANIYQ